MSDECESYTLQVLTVDGTIYWTIFNDSHTREFSGPPLPSEGREINSHHRNWLARFQYDELCGKFKDNVTDLKAMQLLIYKFNK